VQAELFLCICLRCLAFTFTGVFRRYGVFLSKNGHFSRKYNASEVENILRNRGSLYSKKIARNPRHPILAN
jgi:hypothetical protein